MASRYIQRAECACCNDLANSCRFQRDSARNALFSSYDAQQPRSRPASAASASPGPRSRSQQQNGLFSTHSNNSSPYIVDVQSEAGYLSAQPPPGGGFSAYPGSGDISGRRSGDGGFRPATPNKRGQYSDAVMDELESQNEEHVSEMAKKVRALKDVSSRESISRISLRDAYC